MDRGKVVRQCMYLIIRIESLTEKLTCKIFLCLRCMYVLHSFVIKIRWIFLPWESLEVEKCSLESDLWKTGPSLSWSVQNLARVGDSDEC